jgi:ClpP class serine protease
LHALIGKDAGIKVIRINIRIHELDIPTAFDIAELVERLKMKGIQFIGFSEHMCLANFMAICFCDYRMAPPLSGITALEVNFKHYVASEENDLFDSVKIGRDKLPAEDFSSSNEYNSALAAERQVGKQILEKCIELISRAIPSIDGLLETVYATPVELTEKNLLTHVCYEELVSANVEGYSSIRWKYYKKVKWFFQNKRFYEEERQLCIAEIQTNLLDEITKPSKINNICSGLVNNKKNAAVLLIINHTGGSFENADRISSILNILSSRIPVYCYIKVASSSGYNIACVGRKIFMNPCAYLGGIGTIVLKFNYEKLLNKIGFKVLINTSSKSAECDTENTKHQVLQRIAGVSHLLFLNRIAKSRNISLETVTRKMTGIIFESNHSMDNNFVDFVSGYFEIMELLIKEGNYNKVKHYVVKDTSSLTKLLNSFDRLTDVLDIVIGKK